MDDVKKRGCQEVMAEAIGISTAGTRGFGMSIDLDAFDPKVNFGNFIQFNCVLKDCPAVSTPEKDGISTADFLDAIKKINLSKLIATEIAEFLPDSDSKDKKTEQFIAALIREIYTRKWEHRKE
jgi:arginase family enzyme